MMVWRKILFVGECHTLMQIWKTHTRERARNEMWTEMSLTIYVWLITSFIKTVTKHDGMSHRGWSWNGPLHSTVTFLLPSSVIFCIVVCFVLCLYCSMTTYQSLSVLFHALKSVCIQIQQALPRIGTLYYCIFWDSRKAAGGFRPGFLPC